MFEGNRENYQTLDWIIDKSESGLYLAVADEEIQEEIVGTYRNSAVKIFDHRQYAGVYSFHAAAEWIESNSEIRTFFFVNFQFALRGEQDFKRLNFSRDMLAKTEKNLIFFTTPYGDDRLASLAYDFYSFIKVRILFSGIGNGKKAAERFQWNLEEFSGMTDYIIKLDPGMTAAGKEMKEIYILLEKAQSAAYRKNYEASAQRLLQAWVRLEKRLGADHMKVAEVLHSLAGAYGSMGLYKEAEEYCAMALELRRKGYGEEHPVTAGSYKRLADLYMAQGKYEEAETIYRKTLSAYEEALGGSHSDTAACRDGLIRLLEKQGRHAEVAVLK